MDRGRDRRYDDGDRLGGETYRPSDRGAPPRSDYRNYRSPPRRGRTPPAYVDSYALQERRRSRSPTYNGRARSPQRRYSPRRDTRDRSPPPRARRYSRSPVRRPRSPAPRRDPSPYRRPRSPLPMKRERMASPPRERYDRRGASPPRQPRPRYQEQNNHRPSMRSPSPRRSEHVSRIASPISSRRSSPHIHPDRVANTNSRTHSPGYHDSRTSARDAGYRGRSPPRRPRSPPPNSPPRAPVADRTRSPQPTRDDYRNGKTPTTWPDAQFSQSRVSGYRGADSRPPPNGPSHRGPANREPPVEHPVAAVIPMSAHSRPSSTSLLSAPTRPRGGFSGRSDHGGRGDPRDHSYGGTPSYRGGRPPSASPYHAPSRHHDSRPPPSDYPPHGPRSQHGSSGGHEPPFPGPPPFRSNNSSSTTYPRTQRFSNHLAAVPALKECGEALPSLTDPTARKRLAELEEGRKKLMDQIEEKQREKRKNLREWDTLSRESRRESLRSELAVNALETMSGDVVGSGTAF